MPQKPNSTGSIVSESDLVAVVVGKGYVAVQSVRHTGKAWHCLATDADGNVVPVTVNPRGKVMVDSDQPDQPDEPVSPDQPEAPDQPPAQ